MSTRHMRRLLAASLPLGTAPADGAPAAVNHLVTDRRPPGKAGDLDPQGNPDADLVPSGEQRHVTHPFDPRPFGDMI